MSLRVELRLAARQARRAGASSLLVMALVALPIVMLAGGLVFLDSRTPSPAEAARAELGETLSWLQIVGGEDPSRHQPPGDPYSVTQDWGDDGAPTNPERPAPADPTAFVPAVDLLVLGTAAVTMRAPSGTGSITAIVGDAADPLLDGRFELLEGRRPASDREALVSPGLLARLEAGIGDEIVLTEPAATLTIVGVMKQASDTNAAQTVFVAAGAIPDSMIADGTRLWFAPHWQPDEGEVATLNRAGIVAYAHDLATDPRHRAADGLDASARWAVFAVVAVAAAFTAYLVVLLAGAAFAVSARRQERSLAIAASVGADGRSIFRIVLLQGTVLGLLGGVVGAAVGIALASPALLLLDTGAVSDLWGFHVPGWGIAGIVLFAVAVGTTSAVLPARAATRGDVISSLRGSRTPVSVRADRPFWGLLFGVAGVGMTLAGGLTLAALNAAETVDYGDPLRTLCLVGIIAGPLLFQVGVIVAGHWLLSLLARLGARLGLAARIATRDAAAHPSRVVPAFGAIAACVFLASFALSVVGVSMGFSQRTWISQAPLGSVYAEIWADPGHAETALRQSVQALEQTDPDRIAVLYADAPPTGPDGTVTEDEGVFTVERQHYTDCVDSRYHDSRSTASCESPVSALLSYGILSVAAPEDLEVLLGMPITDAERAAFADGGAISLDPDFVDDDHLTVHRWSRDDMSDYYQAFAASVPPTPLGVHRLPVVQLTPPSSYVWRVILSPSAAASIGYEVTPRLVVASFTTPPTPQALDRVALAAGQPWTGEAGFSYGVERGAPDPAPWMWLILAATGVLVLGAAGVALGLARIERRPDDATLAAVGATPGVRRRIAFWQALVIVGVGSVTGTVAGVIPVWGIQLQSNVSSSQGTALTLADVPVLWLTLVALGIPLAIAIVSGLVPARRPDLTRRTVIA